MLWTGVPWGIAHTMPLVDGGYGVTWLANQADPSTVSCGAPAMEIPFGATMLAPKDQLGSGFNTLHLEDVVAFLCALVFVHAQGGCWVLVAPAKVHVLSA